MTARIFPGTTAVRRQQERPVLPMPDGQADKAETARRARALGLALRKGKRVVFGRQLYPPR